MTGRRVLTLLLLSAGGVILFCWLTLLMIDPADIFDAASRACRRHGVTLTARTIGRAFPLGLSLEGVTMAADKPLLTFDRLRLSIPVTPLISGRPTLIIQGEMGEGIITVASTLGKNPVTTLETRSIRLERIPFLTATLGGSVSGGISLRGKITGPPARSTGEFLLDSSAVETRGVSIGGVPLPDALYRSLRGALSISGNRLVIRSFALEGEGIYLRLSGTATLTPSLLDSPLEMGIEILPRPEFVERQKFLFLLLSRHLITPGSYRLPLTGTVGNPRIF